MTKTNRALLAAAVITALTLTGCTAWASVTFPPLRVNVNYTGPDVGVGGATEAPHETKPTPTPEIVQWTPIPTVQPCVITNANSYAVNVRNAPGGAVVGVLQPVARVGAISSATDTTGRAWWEIENPPGWIAGWVVQVGAGC